MLVDFVIISLAMGAVCKASLPHQEFVHSAVLDHDGSYHMLWTPTEDKIIIEVQVATSGYAGLGFSPSGGMTGADMVIGWVDKLGNVQLHDLHGIGNTRPRVDTSQDFTLLGGYQNDTHIILRFSRPWTTCDADHDFKLAGDTTRVIWAYNGVVPNDLSALPYHAKNRGTKSLYLREPKFQNALNEDLQYWEVKSPNVELPKHLDTLYWCSMFKVPNLKKKNHVVAITPLIQPAINFKYVHHMILYQCHIENSEQVLDKFLVTKGTQCYSANMPLSWSTCTVPLATWAVGSEGAFLPDHVGLPLGEEHGGADYFMLEMHYDNPFFDQGIVDNSGLRVYHTDRLREHDAGVLTIGINVEPLHMIPPGVKQWTSFGQCSSDCTKATFPAAGINVTNGLLHTHLLGRGISLRQIRDGKEMPSILKDDNYNFNYQEGRSVYPEMKLLPGDSLLAECHYDSSSRINTTFGGFASRDEMCLIFLTYYPKIDLGLCQTTPTAATLLQPLGIYGFYPQTESVNTRTNGTTIEDQQMAANNPLNATEISLGHFLKQLVVNEPPELANRSWYDILNDKATWTNERLTTFQNAVKIGEHKNNCLTPNISSINGVPSTVKYPEFEPYVAPKPNCNNFMEQKSPRTSNVYPTVP